MNAQLTITHLTKKFEAGTPNEKHALRDFSLEVAKGDFITILGSNGAGKSTLFNAILGSSSRTRAASCSTARISPMRRIISARSTSAACIKILCAERPRT